SRPGWPPPAPPTLTVTEPVATSRSSPQDLLAPERLDEPLDLNHRLASAVARPAARTATITDSPRPSHGLRLARPPSQTRLGRRTACGSHGHHHRLASAVARPAARTATITDSPRPSHGLRLARPPSRGSHGSTVPMK